MGGPDNVNFWYSVNGTSNDQIGARTGYSSWIDSKGDFYVFGGNAFTLTASVPTANDLWRFRNGTWSLLRAHTASGVYGTKGVPSSLNRPPPRRNAVSWVDSNDLLWLYGGSTCKFLLLISFFRWRLVELQRAKLDMDCWVFYYK